MRKFIWLTAALGLASTAQADVSSIYGKWVPTDSQCTYDGYMSDTLFTIDPYSVRYFESGCDIIGQPQWLGVGDAYLVNMSCSGEGDSWENAVIYARTESGLMVYFNDGYSYMAKACR